MHTSKKIWCSPPPPPRVYICEIKKSARDILTWNVRNLIQLIMLQLTIILHIFCFSVWVERVWNLPSVPCMT